jgi:hypothetical protein
MKTITSLLVLATPAALALPSPPVSSHREAPGITETPKVDATDFYLFRSYEPGRDDYLTVVANYLPLQDPYGGPNYFTLDPKALYEIHFDTNGDAVEDVTFRFRFQNEQQFLSLPIGPPGQEISVAVPLVNVGQIGAGNEGALNVVESYTLDVLFGDRDTATPLSARNAADGTATFRKPVDNIGQKSLPDYDAYAGQFVYDVDLPRIGLGRLFVGQRKDPFVVNLGETFDLVNLNPLGPVDGETDDLADKNITSLILEIPIRGLTTDKAVIGGWTSASLPDGNGGYRQVSRLSSPLVNEVVIGLPDKDEFNASEPVDDAQFASYVTNPTLPALLEVLFGVKAPTLFPRTDLVAAFLTGVSGLNQNGSTAEMLRLNVRLSPTPKGMQSNLGVLGGDVAGFPNGRRPGDDVVDIALRVVMGALLPPSAAPDGQLPYTDGAIVDDGFFGDAFPYLRTPLPGSPSAY